MGAINVKPDNIGVVFENIAHDKIEHYMGLMKKLPLSHHVGMCIDTAHLFG